MQTLDKIEKFDLVIICALQASFSTLVYPNTFNGAYVFGGGSAPVLDANNNPTGTTESITPILQYERALQNLPGGSPTTYQITTGTPLVFYHEQWMQLMSLPPGVSDAGLPHATGVVNLIAVAIVMVITTILVIGIKESANFNSLIVAMKVTVLVIFLMAFSLTALGFIIAWPMDSTQAFHGIINLFLIPLWLLSGALFPMAGASTWIRTLMYINPLTYGVEALRALLYPGMSATFPLPSAMATLLLFSLVMFALAFLMANRRTTRPAA